MFHVHPHTIINTSTVQGLGDKKEKRDSCYNYLSRETKHSRSC